LEIRRYLENLQTLHREPIAREKPTKMLALVTVCTVDST
jgi:hypothetical protein